MVNFINTAPLYDVWLRSVSRPEWDIVEAVPSELNRKLHAGELDMGLVSSHEYAAHPGKYLILDGISISSTGSVGSVYLFSRSAPEALAGKTVLLSKQSQTSASLVKIILEEFFGVLPCYEVGSALMAPGDNNIEAVLAIGDEALLLAQDSVYPYTLDLGKIWHERTNLPFVFAVWAVREDFRDKYPDVVSEIHSELLRCWKQGYAELGEICERVAPRVSMNPDACYKYLIGIEHDLSPAKKEGLSSFIRHLIKRGEADVTALPLKIYSGAMSFDG